MFDPAVWAAVPFHFWSLVFFCFGSIVGSFLNVCIHRMPLGQSIISPPSHCPHCNYSIPWYLNIPLVTWLYLKGKCANCSAPISARYFLVELLTGVAFLACWLQFGHQSAGWALTSCVLLAGFIAASFIDFEHFIIPDEITIGGMVVGFLLSFAVPAMHGKKLASESLLASLMGIVIGGGVIYLILRGGKLLFGRQKLELPSDSQILFTETDLILPAERIAYEDLFYRNSDKIVFTAKRLELIDRCYCDAKVRLSPVELRINEDKFSPDQVPHMEAITGEMTLPREAMGFGDVKFMAAIGAFLGWQAAIFSLMISSVIGAVVGLMLILARKQEWSSRLPYGPYIALAAIIWMFGGQDLAIWWFTRR